MAYLQKVKFAFVTVLMLSLLPDNAVAFSTSYANAGFSSNLILGWTQLSSPTPVEPSSRLHTNLPTGQQTLGGANLPPEPKTDTPDGIQTAGGTHVQQPAPDNGTPNGQRTPGGTRQPGTGTCKHTGEPLTALVPENSKGLTAAEHPVFWFYIPDAPQDVQSIEFSLHQDDKTTLYRTSVQGIKTPGIISIPLPPSPTHSLKVNQTYQWRLSVYCNQKETSEEFLALEGWVTRVQQSPNLWYDSLTNLAIRYLSEPHNVELKKAWTETLQSVGLEGLAQAPLVVSQED
jgi:hypothetical protein